MEDGAHRGPDITRHLQTPPIQERHVEGLEHQAGVPFVGLKRTVIVSGVTPAKMLRLDRVRATVLKHVVGIACLTGKQPKGCVHCPPGSKPLSTGNRRGITIPRSSTRNEPPWGERNYGLE